MFLFACTSQFIRYNSNIIRFCSCWASPKTLAGLDFLKISKKITRIKSQKQCGLWLLSFKAWCDQYQPHVKQRSYNAKSKGYWYTHKNIYAAYSLLLKTIPNMFHYLNDPDNPATTNRLENNFGHLKEKQAKRNFIKWYLHSKNNYEWVF